MQQVNQVDSSAEDLEADGSSLSVPPSSDAEGSPRSRRRKRDRLLNALDAWLPYRLWIPPIIFLLVFWLNILLDYPHKAARIEYFNVPCLHRSLAASQMSVQGIMPPDFVAANLSADIMTDLVLRLFLWTGLWWFTFEVMRQLFFIFGIASTEKILHSRRLAQAITGTDASSRAVWCGMVLLWIVSAPIPHRECLLCLLRTCRLCSIGFLARGFCPSAQM